MLLNSTMSDSLLANLNSAQRDAVSSKAQQLAILAGPGSGKTHTLTSRVAWLLQCGMNPENVIVTTFTRKAANEMKERITKLYGDDRANKLILGTFHSIAVKYLRVYGQMIGLKKGFGIADSNDSLSIIKRIIKRLKLGLESKATRSKISTRKATGGWSEKMIKAMKYDISARDTEVAYTEYEAALERDNLLDFDDLLVRCVQLFREHPECVANIEAVLIDEFQDTNLVQFDLMRLMAQRKKRVTIVGDPDQSIYGFRSAEVKNYASLIKQYPETLTISLEENYRSSGQILGAAMGVIQQDQSRIQKTLRPTHVAGSKPVLRTLADGDREGEWIASEIKRALGLTANLMTYDDVAILVRSAFLSMRIENAFGKAGIPYRMANGNTFYERLEIKIILDYMRVVSNPSCNEAFVAVVNEPKRKVGDATVEKMMLEASERKVSLWDMVENGPMTLVMSSVASNGIKKFINIIKDGRKLMEAPDASIVQLIEYLAKAIDLEGYLKKKDKDNDDETVKEKFASRMENLDEFITIARQADDGEVPEDVQLPEVDGMEQDDLSTPLSTFLANIALATDKRGEELETVPTPKVTISTMHAAKGLEWPIVFVPGCFQGGVPNSRGAEENMDEERRIFYVAMTRAKALLYLSYPLSRRTRDYNGEEDLYLSTFLSQGDTQKSFAKRGPSFRDDVVQDIAKILRLPVPRLIVPEENNTLLSYEDDQLPEDGSEARPPNRWDGPNKFGAQAQYGPGQTVGGFGRPQLVEKKSDGPSGPFQPSYKTTMQSMPGFSSAKQVLKEQPTADVAFRALKKRHSDHIIEDDSDDLPEYPVKKPALEDGQRKLQSFFAPKGGPKPATKAPPPRPLKAPAAVPFQSRRPGRAEIASHATYTAPSIDPSLRQHRLGHGALLPTKNTIRPATPTDAKPYGALFSSSPQKPLLDDENAVPVIDLTEDSPAPSSAPLRYNHKSTPKVVHTAGYMTTMDRIAANTNAGGTRTLGAKMSHNGWANRKTGTKPTSSQPKAKVPAGNARREIEDLMEASEYDLGSVGS